jgi:hypothetical protein
MDMAYRLSCMNSWRRVFFFLYQHATKLILPSYDRDIRMFSGLVTKVQHTPSLT